MLIREPQRLTFRARYKEGNLTTTLATVLKRIGHILSQGKICKNCGYVSKYVVTVLFLTYSAPTKFGHLPNEPSREKIEIDTFHCTTMQVCTSSTTELGCSSR